MVEQLGVVFQSSWTIAAFSLMQALTSASVAVQAVGLAASLVASHPVNVGDDPASSRMRNRAQAAWREASDDPGLPWR